MTASGYTTQAVALVATIATETACVFALSIAFHSIRMRRGAVILACIGMNIITHSALWWIMPHLPLSYPHNLWMAEISVTGVEALGFRFLAGLSFTASLATSAVTNTASILVGFIIF